jgi:prophage tail gpP-like protein
VEKVDVLIGPPKAIGGNRGFIEGDFFGYWSELDICRKIDGYSSVGFSAPFEATRKEFRETFRPFTFKPLQVLIDLEAIFTGTLVHPQPDVEPDSKSVAVTAYSLPAVFEDCDAPPAGLKEYTGFDLRQICEALAGHFGIKVAFQADAGAPFKKIKVDPDKKIQAFLEELTKQRNVVISDTAAGELLIWQSVATGSPVCHFEQGTAPLGKVEVQFEPREYFSEMTGFAKKTRKKKPASATVKNPWLSEPFRPHTFKLDDCDRGDAQEATEAKMARMFANMATYVIPDIPSWRDPKGKLWAPNTTITLRAPDAMCYRKTELLVRQVDLHQDKEEGGETATLSCCLPGAFSGKMPTELPWLD